MVDRFVLSLVTGASSGIGEALARLFAEKGINLIITGRDKDRLDALQQELSKKVNVQVHAAELSKSEERQGLVELIRRQAPDLVINNAGWGYYGDALTHETAESLNMVEVNNLALLEFSLEAARAMITQGKKGVIVNVSSAAAFPIFPAFAVYSATKAFDNQFSESFDEETRPYGIRVLAACPGFVATNFKRRAEGKGYTSKDEKHYMTASFAAEEIWRQIQKRKKVHIFNRPFRFLTFLVRYILPKCLVAWVLRKSIAMRGPKREIIKTPHD